MDYLMKAERVLDDDHSFVHLVDSMPRLVFGAGRNARREDGATQPGDQRVVDAARVSIAGHGVRPASDDAKLIRYLVKNRHTSPLEQVVFTFHMRMPIFVARQIIRHRTARVNEESARYGVLADDFYVPSVERLAHGAQATKNKQGSAGAVESPVLVRRAMHDHNAAAYNLYEGLLADGLARELARMVLPLSVYTQWFWQMDLHNLMHFLTLRLHAHAQWEVRQYAERMVPMAEAVAPVAMDAFHRYRKVWQRAMEQFDDEGGQIG